MIKKFEQYQDMVVRLYPEYFLPSKNAQQSFSMPVMEVTFQVTEACSLACSYCYQINKTPKTMTFEIAKTFIDNLFNGKFTGYISEEEKPFIVLDFIGGEPFLQPKLIEQICDYFLDLAIEKQSGWAEHFMISVCTNGVHWFEPDVQHFVNKYHSHLSLNITIDGDKELHDSCRRFPDGRPSYDLAQAAAEDWIKRGGYLGSKITIAPANLQYMNKAIIHFINQGYTEINANTVYEKGWTLQHAKDFYKYLKEIGDYILDNNLEEKIYLSLFANDLGQPKDPNDLQTWCGGVGNSMLACDPDGMLFPCIRYMASSLGDDQIPYSIGDIWNGIGKTEIHAKRINCLACITRRTESTDECFYCPIASGCAECSGYNYQMNGTPNSRCTFICDMHKARTLANAYYWNKFFKKHHMKDKFILNIPENWALEIISQDEFNMLKELSNDSIN